MASLDTRRPAAMEQLASLGKQLSIEVLPIVAGQSACSNRQTRDGCGSAGRL
jgi:signal recognition particle GTPase